MSSHRNLIQSLSGGNGELVLEFFATFSRFEYALKRAHFVKPNRNDARPDWDSFADALNGKFAAITDPDFISAKSYLRNKPPCKQKVDKASSMGWKWLSNKPQETGESDERYFLRLVRDVRNNLFHGGKYPDGPVDEPARNSQLLQACLTILDKCLPMNDFVARFFREV